MKVIDAKPGDERILVRLRDGARERLFALVFGKRGKLSSQLQEVKSPEKELLLQQIDSR